MNLVSTDLERTKKTIWSMWSVRCCPSLLWVASVLFTSFCLCPRLNHQMPYRPCRGVQTSRRGSGRRCLSPIWEHRWPRFYMGCFHTLRTGTACLSTALDMHKTSVHHHWEDKNNLFNQKTTDLYTHIHMHACTHVNKIIITSWKWNFFSSLSLSVLFNF